MPLVEIKADALGLGKPAAKLVETVSGAIGTVYRPRAIRHEADARAYEMQKLARAQAEGQEAARDIALHSTMQRIQTLIREYPDLAERAKLRLLEREVEGLLNIEAIVDRAAEALPESVSDDPIESTWRRKFFAEAENICEVDMQMLWGKLLAGELTQPGTFSLRTLDTLRQLTRQDAELFRRVCSIAMVDGWIAVPKGDMNRGLLDVGISFRDILQLRDAGLVMDGDTLHKSFNAPEDPALRHTYKPVLMNNGVLIQLSGQGLFVAQLSGFGLQLPALLFTRAGVELQRLVEPNENPTYLQMLKAELLRLNVSAKRGTIATQSNGADVIAFDGDL